MTTHWGYFKIKKYIQYTKNEFLKIDYKCSFLRCRHQEKLASPYKSYKDHGEHFAVPVKNVIGSIGLGFASVSMPRKDRKKCFTKIFEIDIFVRSFEENMRRTAEGHFFGRLSHIFY